MNPRERAAVKRLTGQDAPSNVVNKSACKFRVRIPLPKRGLERFLQREIHCLTMRKAEEEAKRQVKQRAGVLIDVEELVSHTWMLKRRWTKKQGWMVVV